jgi:hypothetical protein
VKTYTVYDNMDGGYSIWYQYYDYNQKQYIKNYYYAYSKKVMMSYTKDLENKGYKFVGKL